MPRDDYKAKLRIWAARPTVVPLPGQKKLPAFTPKKFRSHAEMNEWKRQLLHQIAASGENAQDQQDIEYLRIKQKINNPES